MADLTTLEEKLAEVTGLAGAAQETTKKVESMLDRFEFLIMAEAGEVGHWAILGKLNETAGEDRVQELVDWALPIQERHLATVRDGSLELAADEDPAS
jgi:hypothetical protein